MYIICMSTVVKALDLKFKINENDHNPPHVHVVGYGAKVRIDLETLEVMDSKTGFSLGAIRRIQEVVRQNREKLRKA